MYKSASKNSTLTAPEVIQYCHDLLLAYKTPKQVEFRAELPKSNVGKILKKPLRDDLAMKGKKVG